jgi:UDP-N-acetylmuramoyl-L-alanyl-D-glutamate--2,6-diaminopimelate ligase
VLSPSGPSALRPSGLPPRSAAELAEHLGDRLAAFEAGTVPEAMVTGVTLDSRAVRPGDLYAALPGSRAHGAQFAGAAAAAGAVACLTDLDGRAAAGAAGLATYVVDDPRHVLGELAAWVYGDPAEQLTTIGVTGTNGKTTTAYLLESGLRAAKSGGTGLVGTIETRVGDEVVDSVRTTPEAPDLQALLAVMVQRGVGAVAMEVSSHALVLGRVDGTVFDVAVFTNLSEDHLDFHVDLDDYFAAKASLFTPERSRTGVVNVDDEYGARLVASSGVPVVTFSPAGRTVADWRVTDPVVGPRGSTWTLLGPAGEEAACSTALAGDFNLANAAIAVVALVTAGIELAAAAAGVARCPGVPGRMERVSGEADPVLGLVDYAHSPDSLQRLLATCRQLAGGHRVLVVVGAGGDRDPHKRPAMGEIAARDADVAVLTSDNPRSEDPLAIIAALRTGADRVPGAHVEVAADRRAAIEQAVAAARRGDVVVVAGKGHERGQEVAGVVHPFDDREVLRGALGLVRR